jgi:hypothetical protein
MTVTIIHNAKMEKDTIIIVGTVIVAITLYYLFSYRDNKASTAKSSSAESKPKQDPKVFVLHGHSDDHHPIKTGNSLVGLLADDPESCQTKEGGHILGGVLATQLNDFSVVLSTCKTPHHNVLWKSGFLTIGNTGPWHKHDFSHLPRKYEYCRAAACVLALDEKGHILLTRRCKHMRTFPSAWVRSPMCVQQLY